MRSKTDFPRILIKMHQDSAKISSSSKYLGCSWAAQTFHLLGLTFTDSQSFYYSRPSSLQGPKPPSASAGDAKRKQLTTEGIRTNQLWADSPSVIYSGFPCRRNRESAPWENDCAGLHNYMSLWSTAKPQAVKKESPRTGTGELSGRL